MITMIVVALWVIFTTVLLELGVNEAYQVIFISTLLTLLLLAIGVVVCGKHRR